MSRGLRLKFFNHKTLDFRGAWRIMKLEGKVKTTFEHTKFVTVEEVYGSSIECLQKYLGPNEVFIDFRLARNGEKALCVFPIFLLCVFPISSRLAVLPWSSSTSIEPHLIVGDKPKPQRVIFEQVDERNSVFPDEYYQFSNSEEIYKNYKNTLYTYTRASEPVRIYKKITEENEDN